MLVSFHSRPVIFLCFVCKLNVISNIGFGLSSQTAPEKLVIGPPMTPHWPPDCDPLLHSPSRCFLSSIHFVKAPVLLILVGLPLTRLPTLSIMPLIQGSDLCSELTQPISSIYCLTSWSSFCSWLSWLALLNITLAVPSPFLFLFLWSQTSSSDLWSWGPPCSIAQVTGYILHI